MKQYRHMLELFSKTSMKNDYGKNAKQPYLLIKRIFDILFSLLMIVPLLLLTVFIKVVFILKKEKDPLFYKQLRIGMGGKEFKIIKFRTMSHDAEAELIRLLENEDNKDEWEKYHKLKDDPRVTPFGLFLRKSSLDEFPQFINVLKGDMSIIGPRPLVPGELEQHHGLPVYNSVRPGITGWWACNGRSSMKYEERLKYEYYYIENMSLLLDLKIFFKTIACVFDKTGAR